MKKQVEYIVNTDHACKHRVGTLVSKTGNLVRLKFMSGEEFDFNESQVKCLEPHIETIDVTPTWSGILPAMLCAYEQHANKNKVDSRRVVENCRVEFSRMARSADKYNKLIVEYNELLKEYEEAEIAAVEIIEKLLVFVPETEHNSTIIKSIREDLTLRKLENEKAKQADSNSDKTMAS
jgi:hypothetical protein